MCSINFILELPERNPIPERKSQTKKTCEEKLTALDYEIMARFASIRTIREEQERELYNGVWEDPHVPRR